MTGAGIPDRPPSSLVLPLVLAFGALAAPDAGAQAPPPAEAFVYGSDLDSVTLSPDGKYVAMERGTTSGNKIVLFELGQSQPRRVLSVNGNDTLRSLWWADTDTVVADLTTTVRVTDNRTIVSGSAVAGDTAKPTRLFIIYRSMAVDLQGGPPKPLPADNVLRGYTLALGARKSKPETIVVQTHDYSVVDAAVNYNTRLRDDRRESGYASTLLEVDARTGKSRTVERGTPYTSDWLLDADGVAVGRSEWRADREEYTVLARDGRSWHSVMQLKGREYPSLAGLTADGKSVVVAAENGGENVKLWAMPLDGSAAPQVLQEVPGVDIDSVLLQRSSPTVLGYRSGGLLPTKVWLDKQLASQQRSLDAAFPGRTVDVHDRSIDGKRVLVRVGSPSHPNSYYVVDFDTGRADLMGETYPGLSGTKLAEVRTITYLARDGAKIPAYLFIPPGAKAEDLPTVVMPHGGPEARDSSYRFDWFAQFLATRGYAVLQPQFRGSTGFGRAHRLAGYGEWGGRMQDDVTAGVRHLIATGIAHPDKICIVGASYGGYAALAGAAFTSDLYACAASINGVSDLPQMLGDLNRVGGEQSDEISYWKSHIGVATDPRVAARSPARSAANVRAPVLLLHGEYDVVVPRTQSDLMAANLRSYGKPVEYHTLSGEDHWLSSPATRLEMLERLETFLAGHLGGADTTRK
ncbi:MAG TPA: alpha/beta fold hydrolase [Steroidobacteraceae bacterium]|nr:alpha/beta fold hydrolase [Steroidobacteraceae bacterium]